MMPKQTTDVDRLVGIRITALRKARGLSQTALGTAVGVTFQQVQKYEKGQNRVGAGRLREIARLLEVPVSAFFEESAEAAESSQTQSDVFGFLSAHGAIELLRAYAADPATRWKNVPLTRPRRWPASPSGVPSASKTSASARSGVGTGLVSLA